MTSDSERREADALARGFLSGEITRRQLLSRGGRLSAAAVGASALGGILAACGGGAAGTTTTSASVAQKPGGTLQAALTGEPDSLDPAVSQIYTGAQVYDNIFNKLIDIGPDQKYYGELATKWTQQHAKGQKQRR